MSEDLENQQEDFSSQESDDSSVSEELDVGGNVSDSDGEETVEETESEPKDDEKVVLTQGDLDKKMQREREVAKRQARREYERKIVAEAEKKSAEQPQPVQQTQQQNNVWDENLKTWIPKDMTIGQYEQLLVGGQIPQQPVQNVQQPQATAQAQAQAEKQKSVSESLSDDAEDQAIECQADFDDFSDVIKSAALTPSMVNAAAHDKNGIKNLYEMQKSNPQKLFDISRLPRDKQSFAVWKLNEELRRNKTKVMSSATKQPKTLGSSKMIKDDWGSMSDGDLKKKLRNQF